MEFTAVNGLLTLLPVTIAAAFLSGGLGYGFSSLTVPVALLFYVSRVLNPALVFVEIFLNGYSLFLYRSHARKLVKALAPFLLGILPATAIGAILLSTTPSPWLKLITYGALAPLVLLQGWGLRRKFGVTRARGALYGAGIGLLYSLTTISGPPLVLLFANEGLEKEDFKAALALARITESCFTAVAFLCLGIVSKESLKLAATILPGVLVAMPIGALLFGRLRSTAFRRVCLSFDTCLIAFGIYQILPALGLASPGKASAGAFLLVALDLLSATWRFQLFPQTRPRAFEVAQ